MVQPSSGAPHISEDLGGAFCTLHFADELSCFGWLKLRQDCADLLLEVLRSEGGVYLDMQLLLGKPALRSSEESSGPVAASACALCRLLITVVLLNNEPQGLRLAKRSALAGSAISGDKVDNGLA